MNTNGEQNIQRLSVEEWLGLADGENMIPLYTTLYGYSMEPLIRFRKDCVKILPIYREPEIGDVVLFRRVDGVYAVHRVWQISAAMGMVQTWGDNCKEPDSPVQRENVFGIVTEMERDGKRIPLDTENQRKRGIRWMKSPWRRKSWMIMRRVKGGIRRRLKQLVGVKFPKH